MSRLAITAVLLVALAAILAECSPLADAEGADDECLHAGTPRDCAPTKTL